MSEATVIYDERLTVVQNASCDGEDLLLSPEDLTRVSGWELTPEGVCREGLCVPVPPGQERFNLSRLARLLDQPVVASSEHRVWFFGERPQGLASRLASLTAPDFTLPDLDGRLFSLSQFRGRKVFLVTWASW
ncbi:MAG: hypothetical protein HYV92_11470 [Candidatus Rokubacteria bacterium]|nr:hypothetical protein [Candidatus Rokubacteria bacterium]MBI2555002.1 hypothetical protein [Candidatus Rokubacteria bacterium]